MNGRAPDAGFDPIEDAIAAIARGEIVVVADDENRENEGDLIMAADAASDASVAFFVRHTSGVICVGLAPERCDALDLWPMVPANREALGTAFTVTVDLRAGTTTGISAADRARTVRALADPGTTPDDLNRPGHVFPLRARPGGVLERPGHTEAAVDLARLAGRAPAGMLCELVRDDGQMARLDDLRSFARQHDLVLISVADLIRYRLRTEQRPVARETGSGRVPTEWGTFRCRAFEDLDDPSVTHLALVVGDVAGAHDVLVRVHSECITGDVFGSVRCDCGRQLGESMRRITAAGRGVIVYLRGHEGRGIGIADKLRAYELQDAGRDTVDANLELGLPVDRRGYGAAAAILHALGPASIRLLTNNPAKSSGLAGGPPISGREALHVPVEPEAVAYLAAKRDRLGHLLPEFGQTALQETSA